MERIHISLKLTVKDVHRLNKIQALVQEKETRAVARGDVIREAIRKWSSELGLD